MTPGQPVMIESVKHLSDSWDAHAQEWIDWVRAPSRQDSYWRFHRKQFLSHVPAAGRLTVDVGSGEGRVGRDLQKVGHRMLGVDLSFTMCRAATTHSQPAPAVRADAGKLPLADSSADCAIAFMSLQDIDNMPGAVQEIARVLEDDCPLVLAIVHPVYSGGKFSEAKEESEDLFVLKPSYLEPKRLTSTDIHGSLRVTLFREHRPLQAYTEALIEAGFNIEKLIELTDDDPASNREGIPVFLDVLARRRPRKKQADSSLEHDYREALTVVRKHPALASAHVPVHRRVRLVDPMSPESAADPSKLAQDVGIQVEGSTGVGEGAAGDEIDAAFRDRPERVQAQAAASL